MLDSVLRSGLPTEQDGLFECCVAPTVVDAYEYSQSLIESPGPNEQNGILAGFRFHGTFCETST